MPDLHFQKPAHVKRLHWTCLFLIFLSTLQIILMVFGVSKLERLPLDYFFWMRFAFLFIELWFLFLVIRIIIKNYPDVAPKIKSQYLFLLLLYFSVFSLLSEIPNFASFIHVLMIMVKLINWGSFSINLYLLLIAFFCLLMKTILFILTIVHSFKLLKEIRISAKQKNTSTQDLL